MNFENPFFVFVIGIISVTVLDTVGAIASDKFQFGYRN